MTSTPPDPAPSPLSPSSERPDLPGGWLGQAGPFLLLLAVVAYLAARWSAIPDPFVSHWGGGFEPDGWQSRRFGAIFGLPLYGLFCCAMLAVLGRGLMRGPGAAAAAGAAHAEPTSDPGREAPALRRRRASAQAVLAAEWLLALVFGVVAFHPLAQQRGEAIAMVLTVLGISIFGSLALVIWVMVRMGPAFGGWRSDWGGGQPGWRWGGLVYWNPDDPALFVEKRVGMGHAVNFARREPWIYAAVFLAGTVALLWLL